jgi:N-acetylmuramoyl-L-alanine amidase
MSKTFRAAIFAVLSCVTAATLGGTGAATAFASALSSDSDAGILLPQSVISAAADEALLAPTYTYVPDSADEMNAPAQAASLASLVANKADSQTTSREEECLAASVYFESRSEPFDGQLAVARVVLNRAGSGRFPDSVCGVVFQPGQFSFVRGGGFPPIARSSRDWKEAVAISRIARGGLWAGRADNALFFHAARVSPGWRMTRVAAIGNHIFYR